MVRLSQPVLEAVVIADHVEAHLMRKGGVAVTGCGSANWCRCGCRAPTSGSVRIVWIL
jgi:hypothetical protein